LTDALIGEVDGVKIEILSLNNMYCGNRQHSQQEAKIRTKSRQRGIVDLAAAKIDKEES
jgi:hypothetical protein